MVIFRCEPTTRSQTHHSAGHISAIHPNNVWYLYRFIALFLLVTAPPFFLREIENWLARKRASIRQPSSIELSGVIHQSPFFMAKYLSDSRIFYGNWES